MKVCVVTGANSGIGKAVAGALLKDGNKVYCIGGPDGFKEKEDSGNAVYVSCDFRNTGDIVKAAGIPEETSVDVLVNAAGVAYYGLAESVKSSEISDMVDVNVKAPLMLTSALMPKIRKASGTVVNISSVTAKAFASPHGAAYGATKAALSSFGRSLFEEVRKQGVRVINIHPDLTETNLYRNADFTVSGEPDETLFAEDIAEFVKLSLNARNGLCVTDVTLRPQKNRIVKKNSGKSL